MQFHVLSDVISAILDKELQSSALGQDLNYIRLEKLAHLLHYRIACLEEASEKQECLQILADLSEDHADQLLRSPALCQALRGEINSGVLIELLKVEQASSSGKFIDSWSVMGDRWLGKTRPKNKEMLIKRGKRFFSPTLDCGLPIDLSLDVTIANPSAGLQQPFVYSEKTTLDYNISSIDKALELLSDTDPLGYSIFTSLASNLVLRGDAARPDDCWGATSSIAVGRVVIINPSSQKDLRLLAEVILHEAIHCALDCAELENPLWKRRADGKIEIGGNVTSPWTSNELTPHAFLHACVVWAVLLRFWQFCEGLYGRDEIVQERQSFISSGFSKIKNSGSLEPVLKTLSPKAPAVLEAVKSSIFAKA